MAEQSYPREIDPLAVEWYSRPYRRGRLTPVGATLQGLTGPHKTVVISATPEGARAALADLEAHARPDRLNDALISKLLHRAKNRTRSYRRGRSSSSSGLTLSATAQGASALLSDLAWHSRASRTSSAPILESVAATFLRLAVEAARHPSKNRRRYIEDAVHLYGPWIYRFTWRVTESRSNPTPDDTKLLARILAAAERAGFERKSFYSTHPNRHPQLLRWPLMAFLLELCVGVRNKGQWWVASGLTSPFELVQRELGRKRERGSYAEKLTGFFKLILGPDWRKAIDRGRATTTDSVPLPIVRALNKLRA